MGKEKEKDEVKDRLEAAMRDRSQDITVGGRKLTVMKWSWRKGMIHSARMLEALRSWVTGKNMTRELLLKVPFTELVEQHSDLLGDLLAETVMVGNFKDKAEATEFVEGLPYDEFVKLTQLVTLQNFVPLREVFSTIMRMVESGVSLIQRT